MQDIYSCVFGTWQPGIGDPTWQGWTTVAVYLAVAALALHAVCRAVFPAPSARRERIFWSLVALVLLGLAINKQLDLQSALTATGRCLAKLQGWYGQRRAVQTEFIAAIGTLSLLSLIGLLWLLRGTLRRSAPAIVGLCFVSGFVLIRAAGFHHFDHLLGMPTLLSVRANMVLELTGPLLIALAALRLPRLRHSQGHGIAGKP
ncbi:isopropylmalate isomerase [Rhodovulum sulfidophilum]|uniref:isopropylmalate isomerase n=1 Tax=Rhodovulum sulfidophilum TaxID=35806 RepID=UPI00192432E5|nr:isopropylmalate isomerase [Rhodovulum sulfidophilum]MBL3575392.1 isopropylmalate isomerase [Rhodovulum sulfidophilum]MCE8430032.1 isopropylmalate isomerase [Rhodovulum sulfidophilum]MCF4119264.1 isopropylmalate isomerase [Rhodovulum sulfidophilum]